MAVLKSAPEEYEDQRALVRAEVFDEWMSMWTYMIISIIYMRVAMDFSIEGDWVTSFLLLAFLPFSVVLAFKHRDRYRLKNEQRKFPGLFELVDSPLVLLSEIRARRFHVVDSDEMKEKEKQVSALGKKVMKTDKEGGS